MIHNDQSFKYLKAAAAISVNKKKKEYWAYILNCDAHIILFQDGKAQCFL